MTDDPTGDNRLENPKSRYGRVLGEHGVWFVWLILLSKGFTHHLHH